MDHFTSEITQQMSPQPGDLCLECQKLGLVKRLRYFKINIQMEQIIKCESDTCLYPHNDEVTSSASSSLSSSSLSSLLSSSLDNINGCTTTTQTKIEAEAQGEFKTETGIDANIESNCCPSSSALSVWLETPPSTVKESATTAATMTTTPSYNMEPIDTTTFNVAYKEIKNANKKQKLEILSVENLNINGKEKCVQNNNEIVNNVNSQEKYELGQFHFTSQLLNNDEHTLNIKDQVLLQRDVVPTPLWNINKKDSNAETNTQIAKPKMLSKSNIPFSTMGKHFIDIPKADIGTTLNTVTEPMKIPNPAGSYDSKMSAYGGKSKSIYSGQDDQNEINSIKSKTQQETINVSQLPKKLTVDKSKSTLVSETLKIIPVPNTLNQQGSTSKNFTKTDTHSPDRVLTRSATCLALFGIALSTFSLKQMLDNHYNKTSNTPMRKLY